MKQRITRGNPLPDLVAALNKERENDFMSWVLDYAHLQHWKVAHFRGAWSKDGKRYMTPVQADGKGFPDLILIRDCVILAVELKSEKGKVSPAQEEWLSALSKAGITTYIWRPSSREDILRCLSNDPQTTSTIKRMRGLPSSIPD